MCCAAIATAQPPPSSLGESEPRPASCCTLDPASTHIQTALTIPAADRARTPAGPRLLDSAVPLSGSGTGSLLSVVTGSQSSCVSWAWLLMAGAEGGGPVSLCAPAGGPPPRGGRGCGGARGIRWAHGAVEESGHGARTRANALPPQLSGERTVCSTNGAGRPTRTGEEKATPRDVSRKRTADVNARADPTGARRRAGELHSQPQGRPGKPDSIRVQMLYASKDRTRTGTRAETGHCGRAPHT